MSGPFANPVHNIWSNGSNTTTTTTTATTTKNRNKSTSSKVVDLLTDDPIIDDDDDVATLTHVVDGENKNDSNGTNGELEKQTLIFFVCLLMYDAETYVSDKAGEDYDAYDATTLHEAHDPFQNSASAAEKVDAIIMKWEDKKLYNKEDGFYDDTQSAENVEELIAALETYRQKAVLEKGKDLIYRERVHAVITEINKVHEDVDLMKRIAYEVAKSMEGGGNPILTKEWESKALFDAISYGAATNSKPLIRAMFDVVAPYLDVLFSNLPLKGIFNKYVGASPPYLSENYGKILRRCLLAKIMEWFQELNTDHTICTWYQNFRTEFADQIASATPDNTSEKFLALFNPTAPRHDKEANAPKVQVGCYDYMPDEATFTENRAKKGAWYDVKDCFDYILKNLENLNVKIEKNEEILVADFFGCMFTLLRTGKWYNEEGYSLNLGGRGRQNRVQDGVWLPANGDQGAAKDFIEACRDIFANDAETATGTKRDLPLQRNENVRKKKKDSTAPNTKKKKILLRPARKAARKAPLVDDNSEGKPFYMFETEDGQIFQEQIKEFAYDPEEGYNSIWYNNKRYNTTSDFISGKEIGLSGGKTYQCYRFDCVIDSDAEYIYVLEEESDDDDDDEEESDDGEESQFNHKKGFDTFMFTDEKFTKMKPVEVQPLFVDEDKRGGDLVATYETVNGKEDVEVPWEKVEFSDNGGPQTILPNIISSDEVYLPYAHHRDTVHLYRDSDGRYLVVLKDDVKGVDGFKKFKGKNKVFGAADRIDEFATYDIGEYEEKNGGGVDGAGTHYRLKKSPKMMSWKPYQDDADDESKFGYYKSVDGNKVVIVKYAEDN